MATKPSSSSKVGKKSPEEIIAGFNALRNDQRQIASKLYELDNDLVWNVQIYFYVSFHA